MALIYRRKWITAAAISGFVLVLIAWDKYNKAGREPQPVLDGVKDIVGKGFLDPQRNLPEASKLYDFDVKCEIRLKETPFIKHLHDNELVIIPNVSVLETLSGEELSALYHTYIETVQFFCKRIVRLGQLVDGGWDVCHDEAFRPKAPCLMYSFGINNDFSFDDAVIDKYGCEVHSFDPSMNTDTYKRNEKNYFYNLGLSSVNMFTPEGWQMNRLKTIRSDLGHSKKKISILKMDIELWEWDVLPDIIDSGILQDVETLLIEFHLNLLPPPAESGRDTYLRALKILKRLYDLDFRIFYTHRNPSLLFKSKCRNIERVNCHEVNFVKVKKKK